MACVALDIAQHLPPIFSHNGFIHGSGWMDLDTARIRLELLHQTIPPWKPKRPTRTTERILRRTSPCIRQDQDAPLEGKGDNVAAVGGTSEGIA